MKEFFKQFFIISFSIGITIFLLALPSCGPSREEIEFQHKKKLEAQISCQEENKYSVSLNGTCGCDGHTMLKYYDDNGCEYIGHLNNSSSDYITHSGQCKVCHIKDSILLETVLKRFFQVKK